MKKTLIVSLWTTILLVLINFSFSFGWYEVCIDPGHGGDYSGSVGPTYGVLEKNANLTVSLVLRDKIEEWVAP
ncbi:MAG: N-acetylmuramoyl-L-alanine amidase, partial [Candidatus Zixiibacteriota bacterium]